MPGRDHALVRQLLPLLTVLSLFACDRQATTCPEPSTPPPAAGGGLSANVVAVARSQAKVEKLELRVDESGALIKQGAYHDDAAAIPEVVRKLAEQTYPGAQLRKYETEHYAALGDVHEVEVVTADAQNCEVAANGAGELIYTECELDPATLPEPVAARIEATFAGGKILEAERKEYPVRAPRSGGGIEVEFSVEVEHGGREYYLHISADGTLTAKHLRVPAVVEIPLP